jgi:hypothetical protein
MFVVEGEELHTGQLLRNLATGLTNRCLAIHFSMISLQCCRSGFGFAWICIDLALLDLGLRILRKEQRNRQQSTNKPDFQPSQQNFFVYPMKVYITVPTFIKQIFM